MRGKIPCVFEFGSYSFVTVKGGLRPVFMWINLPRPSS